MGHMEGKQKASQELPAPTFYHSNALLCSHNGCQRKKDAYAPDSQSMSMLRFLQHFMHKWICGMLVFQAHLPEVGLFVRSVGLCSVEANELQLFKFKISCFFSLTNLILGLQPLEAESTYWCWLACGIGHMRCCIISFNCSAFRL
jgi:hypothetical protein